MKQFYLFVTLLSISVGYAQTDINDFIGEWTLQMGQTQLIITPIENDENGTKAEYEDQSETFFNPIYPNASTNNYKVFFDSEANTLTFRWINVVYAGIPSYYYSEYSINTFSPTQMVLTNGSETRTYNRQSLSINENHSAIDFQIFPNPALDYLKVSSENIIEKIQVYNVLGRKVMEATSTSINKTETLDVSDLLSGMYIIQIKTAERIVSKRFIKK